MVRHWLTNSPLLADSLPASAWLRAQFLPASHELYMSAKQLQHSMRASKNAKGLVVDASELIVFSQSRFSMELYYDGECFIYTDGHSKFIIHSNYKMKVNREVVKLVNFITATRHTRRF